MTNLQASEGESYLNRAANPKAAGNSNNQSRGEFNELIFSFTGWEMGVDVNYPYS